MNTPSTIDRQLLAARFLLDRFLLEDFLSIEVHPRVWAREIEMRVWIDELNKLYNLMETKPSVDVFSAMVPLITIEARRKILGRPFDETFLAGAISKAQAMAKEKSHEEISSIGRALLAQYLQSLLREEVCQRLASGGNLKKTLNDAEVRLKQINSLNSSRFRKPFPSNLLPPKDITIAPTGIAFLDSLLVGGMLSSEVVSHAATIGSGKTTLVLQVMFARAQQLMAPYKNKPLREVPFATMPRIYGFFYEHVELLYANFLSNAAEIPRKTMEQYVIGGDKRTLSSSQRQDYRPYEYEMFGAKILRAKRTGKQWPPGELERFKRVAEIANHLTMFADFSGGDTSLNDWSAQGVDGMAAYIETHQKSIGNPGVDLCMLDYVGAMVTHCTSSGYYNVHDRVNVVKRIPMLINRKITGRFRCPAWVSHQLNSGENDREGGTIPNPNRTDGCHMFLENCATGFASGKLSEDDNVAVFVIGKSRRSVKSKRTLAKLDSTFARWVNAEDTHCLVDGRILSRAESSAREQHTFFQQRGFRPR